MQTKIKIIKRGELGSKSCPCSSQVERTPQQSARATANTVKSWIAEWEARNRAVKIRRFAVVNG